LNIYRAVTFAAAYLIGLAGGVALVERFADIRSWPLLVSLVDTLD
jgi:hypothetical protein